MILHHYTCLDYWNRGISESGCLKRTESNISMKRRNPNHVVWLIDTTDPYHGWNKAGLVRDAEGKVHEVSRDQLPEEFDKSRVRITVNVPDVDVHHWPKWSVSRGITKATYQALAETGGDPNSWYVVVREIPQIEWVRVEDTKTGEVLWQRESVESA